MYGKMQRSSFIKFFFLRQLQLSTGLFFFSKAMFFYVWKDVRICIHYFFPEIFPFFFVFFKGQHPWQMEFPRLGVESELQLLTYITAIAIPDLSQVFDLHHSPWQHQSLTHWVRLGINLCPHGCLSDSFPLSNNGNSSWDISNHLKHHFFQSTECLVLVYILNLLPDVMT